MGKTTALLSIWSIYPAFNPQNFNLESINIFGDANECGLLLIHKSKMKTCLSIIESLKMPAIKKMDDLVLLLLHKPQYAYEVLVETSVAIKLGINYSAPILKNTAAENFKLGQLVRAAESALSSKSAEAKRTSEGKWITCSPGMKCKKLK